MQLITEDAIEAADLWSGQIPEKDLRSALENAQPLIIGPELADLRERIVNVEAGMQRLASQPDRADDAARLKGKAEGLRLAMSYLDEITRSL